MRQVKTAYAVDFPDIEIVENFEFNAVANPGQFKFHFKWLNDRWNCWVTLPDQTVRECGVYPNVASWSGFSDYGIYFKTSLENITYNNLMLTELYILEWE